jgi:D-alanyl-D-alanine carboxypeptidase
MLTPTQEKRHAELGIPADYGNRSLPFFDEATDLVDVGANIVGRMQRLAPLAATRWHEMVVAAGADGVNLLIVSGFRSFDYQAGLIQKKLESGQAIDEILQVNAAPGYSEHHSGRAVDIATPGSPPLVEDFENLEAFAWLTGSAGGFGFKMTYPRENRQGFIYEPWHWALAD